MQGNAKPCEPATIKVGNNRQHNPPATYKKMLDKRKHAIRGLWQRNDRYYAQMSVEDPISGIKRVKRVPLEGATTDARAVAKYQELLVQRSNPRQAIREDQLPKVALPDELLRRRNGDCRRPGIDNRDAVAGQILVPVHLIDIAAVNARSAALALRAH